jgi:hypothetical protein
VGLGEGRIACCVRGVEPALPRTLPIYAPGLIAVTAAL